MVSKSGPDLQRRHRGCTPRDLAPSDFFHVPPEPRQYRNSEPYLEPNGKCTRSCRLNWPKTSLDPGRMAVPRISALLMLRSTISTVSAPATCPFRGSITYPTQLLCTLRGRRYRRLTQHLLPGGPLRPYPDRSCTGWTAPAFVGAFGSSGSNGVAFRPVAAADPRLLKHPGGAVNMDDPAYVV